VSVKSLKALILIGGFGTRLRPLTCTRPKALFPIVNKPLLQWTFEKLAADGVTEVILAVNKLTQFHIREQHLDRCGLKVHYSTDPPKLPLGTAGPVKKAQKLLGDTEPFLVLNGDLITEISYRDMLNSHIEGKAIATIALHEVEDPSRYGVAELASDNQIKRFIEKPLKGSAPTNLINAGVYVLSPKIFSYLPKGKAVSMEREVFPKLVAENALFGHKVDGLWIDIGKPEDYLQTNKMLLMNSGITQNRANIDYSCSDPVAFAKGVIVGKNSSVGPCVVLGKNVSVGKDVRIRDSVVFPDVIINDGAVVEGALIGEAAYIGKNVRLPEGCIIADHARIKDGVVFQQKASVCPAKEVSSQDNC
jgi:mannose-1-phosphate guanylyltransferase